MLSKHFCCLVSLSPAILSWLAGLQSLWPFSSQYLCELLPDIGGFCTNPAFCMNVFPSVSGHFLAEPGQAGKVGPGSGRAVMCSGSSQLLDAIRSNLSTRKHRPQAGSPAALVSLLTLESFLLFLRLHLRPSENRGGITWKLTPAPLFILVLHPGYAGSELFFALRICTPSHKMSSSKVLKDSQSIRRSVMLHVLFVTHISDNCGGGHFPSGYFPLLRSLSVKEFCLLLQRPYFYLFIFLLLVISPQQNFV